MNTCTKKDRGTRCVHTDTWQTQPKAALRAYRHVATHVSGATSSPESQRGHILTGGECLVYSDTHVSVVSYRMKAYLHVYAPGSPSSGFLV